MSAHNWDYVVSQAAIGKRPGICSPISCGSGFDTHPSVEILSCAWLLTIGIPLMDCRNRQTAAASPAEPEGLPLTLVGDTIRMSHRVVPTLEKLDVRPNFALDLQV